MVVDTSKRNNGYLKVEGSAITRNGKEILLKGASLGGWSESPNQ